MKVDRRLAELATLVELSALINSSLDIQTVLDNAMKCVEEFINAEASSIFEVDQDRGELFFRLARGEKGHKVKEVRLKIGEGIAGWVAQTGKPVVVSDTRTDTRFTQRLDTQSGFQTRSILCVPLNYKGQLVGAVEVLNKKDRKGFDEKDQEMLTILGNQIAMALENAKLYTRLKQKFAITTEELKVAQAKLIRSERLAALGRLSQGVAHEVRNPVTSIGGFAHLVQKKLAPDDPNQEYLKIIRAETQKLERMVKDIEWFTNLREAVLRPTNILVTAEKALSSILEALQARSIELERAFSDVPEIPADDELLELALEHVLTNAIEAMPGGGSLRLAISAEPKGVLISIKDTGKGITLEDLPNVFDPFFTSKTQGSGLGLTTVNRIISDHNGEIKISSEPGKGTEVKIWLPRWQQT